MWQKRDIEKIAANEARKVVKQRLPHDVVSMTKAIARTEVANAQITQNGAVDFATEDATPYELEITIPGDYSIGQIEYSLSIALSDGTESAFYRGFHTFRNEGGTASIEDGVDLLAFTTAGTLATATQTIGIVGEIITITFTGIAATDIEGKIVYTVASRELTGPIIP